VPRSLLLLPPLLKLLQQTHRMRHSTQGSLGMNC
jgi:hypothetical protein